jgi:hypothetical protein
MSRNPKIAVLGRESNVWEVRGKNSRLYKALFWGSEEYEFDPPIELEPGFYSVDLVDGKPEFKKQP